MREFWKMASFKSKIAVLLSEVAIIAAVVGMFVLKTEMRVICWACLICVWAINYGNLSFSVV
jgi:threonine/homoserine efflux transporter RhtA